MVDIATFVFISKYKSAVMPLKNAHTLQSFVKAEDGTSPSKIEPEAHHARRRREGPASTRLPIRTVFGINLYIIIVK